MNEETPQGVAPEGQSTPMPPAAPAPPPPPPAGPPPTWQPRPVAPPRRGSGWKWGCGLAAGGCLLLVLLFVVLAVAAGSSATWSRGGSSRAPVALIRIEGVISSSSSSGSLFGGSAAGAEEIIRRIDNAARDASVKAILLRINSPGGSAAASQEVYAAVLRARKQKKVVVSMGDMAASGGYYIASAADQIYANPATATGSIGVIVEYANIQGLMDKIGVKHEAFKSGKLKDMLSPTKPVSPEARQVIQGVIMDIYNQFVSAVAEGRKGKLTRAQVLKLADGRIYSGQQAKDLKLIDELGGLQDALDAAGRLGGVSGRVTYREYTKPPSLLRQLLGSDTLGPRQAPVVKAAAPLQGGILYDGIAAQLVPGPWQLPARPEEP